MLETTHTPEPWEIGETYYLNDEDGNEIECQRISRKADNEVGFISFDQVTLEEGNANAKLMIAAPEMLEALIEVRKDFQKRGITIDNADSYNRIDLVIKKATS